MGQSVSASHSQAGIPPMQVIGAVYGKSFGVRSTQDELLWDASGGPDNYQRLGPIFLL